MAVVNEPLSSRLQVVVETGVDGNGDPILRTRSYNGVKVNALDEDVFAVATAIAGLQQRTLHSIRRVNENELTEQ